MGSYRLNSYVIRPSSRRSPGQWDMLAPQSSLSCALRFNQSLSGVIIFKTTELRIFEWVGDPDIEKSTKRSEVTRSEHGYDTCHRTAICSCSPRSISVITWLSSIRYHSPPADKDECHESNKRGGKDFPNQIALSRSTCPRDVTTILV